jgi:hypothetical protein
MLSAIVSQLFLPEIVLKFVVSTILLRRKQRMIITGRKITTSDVSRFLNYETVRYVDKLQKFQQVFGHRKLGS